MTIFNFIWKNIFPILLGITLYTVCLLILWGISFGDYSRIPDNFSLFVTSSLGFDPPQGIFDLLNFPFAFPPWDLPIPIFCGGIYYALLTIAVWKMVAQKKLSLHIFFPKRLWSKLLFQKSVWLGGLFQVMISLVVPIANLPFFIIGMLIVWCIAPLYGNALGSCFDKYWIIPLYFITAFVQGAYYGYLYIIYRID
jgi:hypothetical protein